MLPFYCQLFGQFGARSEGALRHSLSGLFFDFQHDLSTHSAGLQPFMRRRHLGQGKVFFDPDFDLTTAGHRFAGARQARRCCRRLLLKSSGRHIHPSAWLSGVYYVQLPELASQTGQGEAGWIEFGRPPEHFHCTVEPEVRAIRPEPGLMLLFPSYFYHRTMPFESAGLRISISFDVHPQV